MVRVRVIRARDVLIHRSTDKGNSFQVRVKVTVRVRVTFTRLVAARDVRFRG